MLTVKYCLRQVYGAGPHTCTVAVYLSPGQVPFARAAGVQDAVIVTLSGVDPQLGKADGETVTVIASG